MHPAKDEIVGQKYRLIRQLDEGGMSSIWLARHLDLQWPVVVKLLADDAAAAEDGVQRFLREARAAAALRSPHVVQIFDYGVQDSTAYIVMEFLEGESLASRLRREGPLSWRETAVVFRQLGRAVELAHAAGIVHRDLKPANIFLVPHAGQQLIKLLDFGIAKASHGALGSSLLSHTRTGTLLGTPFYMSPEQIEGKRIDARTDIWSLGVIAFECLLGAPPFAGDTLASLVLAICSRPLPIPSRCGVVSEGFDAWFARACDRTLESRFASAGEAVSQLLAMVEASSGRGDAEPGGARSGGTLGSTLAHAREIFGAHRWVLYFPITLAALLAWSIFAGPTRGESTAKSMQTLLRARAAPERQSLEAESSRRPDPPPPSPLAAEPPDDPRIAPIPEPPPAAKPAHSLLSGLSTPEPAAGAKSAVVRAASGGPGLEATAIQRTVRKYAPEVRQNCWQRALNARAPGVPDLAKVTATIVVDPSGRVQSVTATGAPRGYPGLSLCIEQAVRGWRFPSSLGITVTNVPFVFIGQ